MPATPGSPTTLGNDHGKYSTPRNTVNLAGNRGPEVETRSAVAIGGFSSAVIFCAKLDSGSSCNQIRNCRWPVARQFQPDVTSHCVAYHLADMVLNW
jgi:hypothetical protein